VKVYSHPASTVTKQSTAAGPAIAEAVATLAGQDWATKEAAEKLDAEFRAGCERDLRSAAARFELYLEDPRTVSVLLGHARERVTDEYVTFAEVAADLHPSLTEKLLGTQELGSLLRRVCELGK
jgi:conserved oligomeric Golgi complex subunit 3